MKTKITPDELYVQNPAVRLQNTINHLKEFPDAKQTFKLIHKDWPKYWWGVSNAWLVFVGPSPGNSNANPIDWKIEKDASIGVPHTHFVTQNDSTGFWKRMREWTQNSFKIAGIFNDINSSLSMVLLANVLDTRQGDSTKLTTTSLLEKIPSTVDHLKLVRPCVIVPMEKRVSKLLMNEFLVRGYKVISGPKVYKVKANHTRYNFFKPKSWVIKTEWGDVLFAESPQHPSRKNFYVPKLVDNYLADRIKEYLSLFI